jgi:hypothetical protein
MAPIEKETMGGSKYVKKAAKSQMNGATDDNGGHLKVLKEHKNI